jgi:hypothetical protein
LPNKKFAKNAPGNRSAKNSSWSIYLDLNLFGWIDFQGMVKTNADLIKRLKIASGLRWNDSLFTGSPKQMLALLHQSMKHVDLRTALKIEFSVTPSGR